MTGYGRRRHPEGHVYHLVRCRKRVKLGDVETVKFKREGVCGMCIRESEKEDNIYILQFKC